MKFLKILWIDDELTFGASIQFRIIAELDSMQIELAEPECLNGGRYVYDTVRDWKPDIIMMDHNLQDVKQNGAQLITEIRFRDNDLPIIYYSTEMDERLVEFAEKFNQVFTSTRQDVSSELVALLKRTFLD